MAETDHPLKRLMALAAADFAAWLLGHPVRSVTTRPTQLTATPDPIETDQVFFATLDEDAREVILHLEFQGPGSDKPMPLRLLEYGTRLSLTYRDIPIRSVVLYLGGAGARDTGEHALYDPDGQVRLAWRYGVVRLWQLDAEDLLALDRPAILALVGQTRIRHPEQTIPEVITRIGQGTSGELRERLLAEFLLLCSDKEIATMAEQLITRDYGLPETPMMQKLRAEGREEGRVEGREEGRVEGREEGRVEGLVEVVVRQLTRRCGALDAATTTRVQQLDPPRLLDLADALLDFTGVSDLELWLTTHAPPAAEMGEDTNG